MNIVVCGGGINGASVAYYLAKKGAKCTVVEQTGIACAASGKSGGFLASNWSGGTTLEQLSEVSFGLHMQLMEEFPNCDYRKVDTFSVGIREGAKERKFSQLPDWVDGPATNCSTIGSTSTTAQVHPFKLTNTFIEKAKELASTEVKIGSVTDITISNKKVTSVTVDDKDIIPADVVIITMGPWSGNAQRWLNIPKIKGQRAHSIIMKPDKPISPHALFIEYSGNHEHRSPEIYPRPDGTVYVCGMTDDVALPDTVSKIQPNSQSCKTLKELCGKVSSDLARSEVIVEQACYLPISSSGVPLIGKVPDVDGAYIAAGHSCWGILNAPGTGAALAELIIDGKSTILDLSPFDPIKFCMS